VEERAKASRAACEDLQRQLMSQDGPEDWQGFAALMARQVSSVSDADIPAEMRELRFDLAAADLDLANRPFRHQPCRVQKPPQAPAKVQPATAWRPHWIEDILKPKGVKALEQEYARILK
jgi:hypothetical protein